LDGGKLLALDDERDSSLAIADLRSGREVIRLPSSQVGTIYEVGYLSGNRLLVGRHAKDDDDPASLRIWDVNTGKIELEYRDPSEIHIWHAATSGDGSVLAIGAEDRRPRSAIWTWIADKARVLGIDLEPDAYHVVLIETSTGREVARLPGGPAHSIMTCQAAFSPDGRQLAVSGNDGILRIWNVPPRRSWSLILSLPLIPAVPLALFGVGRRRRARAG
jgi:WD40 repeat protein